MITADTSEYLCTDSLLTAAVMRDLSSCVTYVEALLQDE